CRGGMSSNKTLPFSTVNSNILATIRTNMNSNTFLQGMSTGFAGLDKLLSGFQKSDLLILAARPSMGKTALAVNFAVNVAKSLEKDDKGAVGFFSLEMSADQLGMRILSMESGINASLLRAGKLKENELLNIMEYSKRIQNLPLYIDDTPSISIQYVRSSIRKMVSQFNVKFVVIDYLQLLRSGRSDGNRVQEITEITQGLKAIAKECNVPVLALSQLSRLVEQRDDKKPLLSDLRESGSIEQDSDIVMFLYREEYYKARLQPDASNTEKHQLWQSEMDKLRNKAEIIIAKHRNGPIGNINLNFDLNSTKFNNYTPYQSHNNQDNK
ncbi:MAG: AAA family ATPase, partial [Anaplasmataceae bacterium]|nr:AAA family ATPase [Anaplasmataceae bacterium]